MHRMCQSLTRRQISRIHGLCRTFPLVITERKFATHEFSQAFMPKSCFGVNLLIRIDYYDFGAHLRRGFPRLQILHVLSRRDRDKFAETATFLYISRDVCRF